jgi:formate dehydrogenase major subunit
MNAQLENTVTFWLDGEQVTALPNETIWECSKRLGKTLPHLCHADEPGYRSDGNCRACMVEIEGERVLTASCIRQPNKDMKVNTANPRVESARKTVFELLAADQPPRAESHDPNSKFWQWAEKLDIETAKYPRSEKPAEDVSHPAMNVYLDACINCNLCVRACREVQVNDVIGMANRGSHSQIVFDLNDPMGDSTCVACGECVQACPTGALIEKTLVDDTGKGLNLETEDTASVCPFCGVGCQINYQTVDDKIVSVQGLNGPANEQRLCVKGRFGFDYVANPQRLIKPLIRKDDAPKAGDCEIDPRNYLSHFREATWEEAMSKAAEGLSTIRDNDGKNALSGFGSAKGSNEEAYLFQKIVRVGFGTNNIDHCTRLCHASSVSALLEGVGSGAVTAPFTAAEDAETIILIGSNPTENHPVAATYFKQAAKRGANLVVMDPRGMAMKRHASHMLQFKPGTDVAMLNAILNVIVTEGWVNQDYIAKHTEGYESLKAHIANFTPEAMEPICGIPAQMLREVAHIYANSKASIIFWGMGVSQHTHGTDNARCLIALALVTGQVGRKGTGLHPLRGQNNVQGASDAGLIPMFLPDYQSVEDPNIRQKFENVWGSSIDPDKGLTVVEIMDAIHDDKVKGMYIMGENPAMSDPDVTHARAALAKLQCLVVQDIFFTETCNHADVIFPASAWPEKDGTVTNTNRQVQRGRAAIKPPGDARQDWELIVELANRMGCDWHYPNISSVYTEMASVMPSLNNISWDRVSTQNAVTYPCSAPDQPGQDIVFADGFPRENRRGKMVPASVIPPAESPDAEYPMILTTGRILEHWHTGSMTRRATVLDELQPEPMLSIHPDDMEKYQIKAGDIVQLSTRRGKLKMNASMDNRVPPGVVFLPFCFVEAAANVLTNPKLDPYGKIPEFKFSAAKLEKV